MRLLCAALFSMAVSLARADDVQVEYYDIAGSSERELRHQMNAKGPMGTRGHRVDGHTHWRTSWKYRYAPAAGGCAFTRIDVAVTGTMTLPRWAGEAQASGSLAKKWRSFASALRRHEEGHYAHGLEAGEEIEALGRAFRVPGSCATIEDAFREQAKAIIDRYRAADVAYDEETRHGKTQGVRFP